MRVPWRQNFLSTAFIGVEALPYLVAAILILRQNKVGYALGFAAGGVWLLITTWRTTFVANGFESLFLSLRTGQLHQFLRVFRGILPLP